MWMSFVTCPLLIILYNTTTHNMCNKYVTIRYIATQMTMMITAFWNAKPWFSATLIKEAQVLSNSSTHLLHHIMSHPRRRLSSNRSNFLKIPYNIIFPFLPASSKRSSFLMFPTKAPYASLPYTCHMPCPSHSLNMLHPKNIWWAVYIMMLLIMWFPPVSCNPILFNPNIFHTTLHSSINI